MNDRKDWRMSSKLAQACLAVVLTAGVIPARAAEPVSADEPSEAATLTKKERRELERAERRAARAAKRAAGQAGPSQPEEPELSEDAVAVDVPDDGRWAWVDAMGGEIPTDDQMEAIEEIQEQHLAEQELIDELSGRAPPVQFYRDPVIALATDPLLLDLVDAAEFDIPIETNPWVAKWIRYFNQGQGRQYMEKWLQRAPRYEPMMRDALGDVGLPRDLVYLSMIESGYNAHAYSRAAAAGLWQFVTQTGLEMGLRIDWWVDERRDPEASLEAAITYLAQLRDSFGDWRLAWASYNGGPGRVQRAIARAGTRDFWTLADGPYLHPETDNYVPKIMAAAIIARHPDRYGFEAPDGIAPLDYDKAHVEGSVELEVLARCAGVSIEEIRELNPALRRFATPPEGYDVRVPEAEAEPEIAVVAATEPPEDEEDGFHVVRRGDTLSGIAARHGLDEATLKAYNSLGDDPSILVGQRLRLTEPAPEPEPVGPVHTVRRGETLGGIATRYGVGLAEVMALNDIDNAARIEVGQQIRLPVDARDTPKPRLARYHTVRRGETLSHIARKYRVSVKGLMRLNGLTDPSLVRVGQRLRLVGDPPREQASREKTWGSHTVRGGESLAIIAGRYGCSVADLVEWNGLSDTTIQPGQVLRVLK